MELILVINEWRKCLLIYHKVTELVISLVRNNERPNDVK